MSKPRLFLVHFAGGNIYSYKFLTQHLPEFELVPLELPGRGKRMPEPLLRDLDAAANDIARQIVNRVTSEPYVLYGHSMGASLALKAAHILSAKNSPPSSLIVSGNSGPGRNRKRNIHLLDRNQFLEEVKLLGGLPDEFLNDPELVDFFEPILRHDFALADMKDMLADLPPLSIPIYALMGSTEDDVAGISNWSRFTSKTFGFQVLEGNHFFIFDHAAALARIIRQCHAASLERSPLNAPV